MRIVDRAPEDPSQAHATDPGGGHHHAVEELRNIIKGDELWDDDGCLWRRGKPRWLDARAATRWVHRGRPAVFHGPDGHEVTWLGADQVATWWAAAADAFEVPGISSASTTLDGQRYAAAIWRSGDRRRLSFEAIC